MTTVKAPNAPNLSDKLSIKLLSELQGPALANMSEYQNDKNTGYKDESSPIGTANSFYINYKPTTTTVAGTVFNGNYTYVNNKGFTFKDPYLHYTDTSLIKSGNFNMVGQVRLYPGISSISQDINRKVRLYVLEDATYEIARSHFSLEFIGYVMPSFYKGHPTKDRDMVEYYGAPGINYEITPTLRAQVLYEMQTFNTSTDGFSAFAKSNTDLMPNISWDVTKAVNLNPYLYIFTGNRVAPDTTLTGMYVTVKFL